MHGGISTKKISPLDDRVVIKPQMAPEKSPNGIIIPDAAKKAPAIGLVIAVGPGRIDNGERMDVQVETGDTVVYSKYAGTEIEYEGDKVLILSESEILAKIG